jgi:hypothetical protein
MQAFGRDELIPKVIAHMRTLREEGDMTFSEMLTHFGALREAVILYNTALSESPANEATRTQIDLLEVLKEKWAEFSDSDAIKGVQDQLAETFSPNGTLVSGISDAIMQVSLYGKKSSEVFKALGRTIVNEVVGSLIKAGVQMAINWAKEKIFGTAKKALAVSIETTQTAAHATGTVARTGTAVTAAATETAAWTPAAMMASLASFGTNALMAIAGIMAVSKLMKSFDGGGYTGSGARSGGLDGKGGFMAMMHPNETVIDHSKGQSIGGGGAGNGGQTTNEVNIDFTVNAMDSQSFQQSMAENADLIIGVIRSAFHEQGEAVVI